MEAVHIAFDVYVECQEGFTHGPHGCGRLSHGPAYQVGILIGKKKRALLRFYASRWIRNSSIFKVSNYAEPLMPVFFVKCRRAKTRDAIGTPPKASRSSQSAADISIKFQTDDPVDPNDLGFPIVVYRTAVSAATHALVQRVSFWLY